MNTSSGNPSAKPHKIPEAVLRAEVEWKCPHNTLKRDHVEKDVKADSWTCIECNGKFFAEEL